MNDNRSIPFLDLPTLHQELEAELMPVFRKALLSAGFVGGPIVEGFEREFAHYCGARFCVGVGSGTDALRFALIAAGVQPGDIVITAPNTFIATTEAISQAGARLDFVDIDDRTYNMDPAKLQQYIDHECYLDRDSGKPYHRRWRAPVTAVVPVHLYGQIADMDPILDIASRYKMIVVEDACQAHGAEYFSKKENRWRKAGSIGHSAAFSFYPGKNLGACGEAGGATTDDEGITRKMRMLRDHGQSRKYYHDMEGYNGRLDAIQAGFLTVKLQHLSKWNRKRQEAALRYDELLSSVDGVITPYRPDSANPVYHLYVIRVRERDALLQHLAEAKIGTGIHYPVPLHLQKSYEDFGYGRGTFPITEKVASEIVSLPMFPQLTAEQQVRVVEEIRRYLSLNTGYEKASAASA